MTHGDVFSGIGGFSLSASWLGWTNVFQCEIDPFCRKVLKHHFPNTIQYEDIKKTNFSKHAGTIDVLSGGAPCQPFSVAGHRKGTADDRHLWPEMLRVIREVSPRYVVAENVCGLLSQQRGVVFESVCADMEAIGYEVQPFVIPACAVDAPHRRDRVWIVAMASDAAGSRLQGGGKKPNAGDSKLQSRRLHREPCIPGWDNFPTVAPVCGRDDGLSVRLDGITFPSWRRKSISALGNSVVPQVVYQIFKTIEMTDNINFIQQRIK